MLLYIVILILLALITGIILLHFGKKEGNKTKRTIGLILLILGILIAVFCAVITFLIVRFCRGQAPSL